jgi:hypothetical protein
VGFFIIIVSKKLYEVYTNLIATESYFVYYVNEAVWLSVVLFLQPPYAMPLKYPASILAA